MPDLVTSIQHLANIDLYTHEKPYCVIVSADHHAAPTRKDNLVFERHNDVVVRDLRDRLNDVSLEKNGFVVLDHSSSVSEFRTMSQLQSYRLETEKYLQSWFEADLVVCWDVKIRSNERNVWKDLEVRDLRDWTIPDPPAIGAHNDVTFDSGPRMIKDHLPSELHEKYLSDKYRYRIVNTWRSLLPIIEDSPLALCDFRSVDKNDLLAADRVIPTRAGEVYYLRYNQGQKWYWLEHMTPNEPLMFVVYDSAPGTQARYCPHVPVHNSRAPADAPKRQSVETRSIIITRMTNREM